METQVVLLSPDALRVIKMVNKTLAKSPTGVSYIGVRYYTNKQGEISHYTLNVGQDYGKAVAKDIETLRNFDPFKYQWKSSMIDIQTAIVELLKSFEKPDEARSQGQKDAYTHIVPGIKVHNATAQLVVYGYVRRKEVLVKGERKTVNHSNITRAKNEVREHLRTSRYRQFFLDTLDILSASGNKLMIEYSPKAVAL